MIKNTLRTTSSAAALGLYLATSQIAVAQSTENVPSPTDIIVTARRVEERLQDVPISITVYNQQQLTERNVVSGADLATYVPSLSANPRYGLDSTSFSIRGFVQESGTSPSVGVYFADVVAPRGNGTFQGGNGAGAGSFFDLENVQVLKGPQGTLFGRNTTGGAILLVPHKPTDKLEGYIEGTYGNFDQKRIQAVLNVPLSDTFRLRLGADYNNRDGYLHNKIPFGPKDFANIDYIALRGSMLEDFTPNLQNYTIVSYSRSKSHGLPPRLTLCGFNVPGFTPSFLSGILAPIGCAQVARQNARGDGYWDVESSLPNPGTDTRQWQTINTTTWHASDALTIKNIISYAEFRQSNSLSVFGTSSTNPVISSVFPALGTDNTRQSTFTEELQFQGDTAGKRLAWQAGAYFERSQPLGFQGNYAALLLNCSQNIYDLKCTDPFVALLGVPFGNVSNTQSKYDFRNLGLYAQATYKLTDQFSVTGGIRYTSDRTRGIGQATRYLFLQPNVPTLVCANTNRPATSGAQCETRATQKSSRPTWLVDLDYKPTNDVLIYAKYARGYRQGGVNVANTSFLTWEPEKVDLYEVGAKLTLTGRVRGFFNIAAFYNNFTKQQLTATAVGIPPIATAASVIVNSGKSRITGVEIDASISPVDHLTFDLNYAYLNTKLKSFTPPPYDTTQFSALLPAAAIGGPLNLAPKNKLTLTGTYTLPLEESLGRLSVGATYTYTDKQLAVAFSPVGVIPATNLLNVNVNWAHVGGSPLDASFFMTNVTNEKYPVYASGSFSFAGFDSVFPGAPRIYGIRLRYSFSE